MTFDGLIPLFFPRPIEVVTPAYCLWRDLSDHKEEWGKNHVKNVIESLQPQHYDLSEEGQTTIRSHLKQVQSVLNLIPMPPEQQNDFFTTSRDALGKAIEDKWVERKIQFFYDIPRISDENERAKVAQTWTHSFFMGAQFLNPYELFAGHPVTSEDFVNHLVQKTSAQFQVYAQGEKDNRIATRRRLLDKNSDAFFSGLEGVEAEKEREQYLDDLASIRINYWPEIEDGKTYLANCIKEGFKFHRLEWGGLHRPEFSIENHPDSLEGFKNVFKKQIH